MEWDKKKYAKKVFLNWEKVMKNVFDKDKKVANKFDIAVGIGKRAQWLDSVFPFSCRRVESLRLQKQKPR